MKFVAVRKNLPAYIKEGALIVDVRPSIEFTSGHIEGSINIPLSEFRDKIGDLNPEKTVLLYCNSGSRSTRAAAILKEKGFKKVINVGPWSNLKSIKSG